jgi:hypothetical protein
VNVLRAVGVAAVLAWLALALDQLAEWPRAGFMALGIAAAAAFLARPVASRVPAALLALPGPAFVGACAAAAAGISGWAVRRAMNGRPLSIDAAVYLMQARAMAHGHLGLVAPHPVQAFGDRFLIEGPDRALYGIFPPGWPLAIAPFAAMGVPMLAGPVVAALLVVAQAALGRAVGRAAGDAETGEIAMRVSLLLSLASIGRALETADLLSHGFVAALAALAVAGALAIGQGTPRGRTNAYAAGVGVCVGWVVASRLLDGIVLGAVVAGVLLRYRAGWRDRQGAVAAWLIAGAAPLLAFLIVEQHAATGAWLIPTQSAYFERTDWPPNCHRLGFGPDIGCTVEHPGTVRRLGGDGYHLSDALDIVHERARALGEDLVGWPPVLLVGFVPLAIFASSADAALLAFVFGLTLAYGLFYYGNAMFFGARHLFPVAAFFWLLVARGAALVDRQPRLRGVATAGVLAAAVAGVWSPWAKRTHDAADFQATRSDLRRTMDKLAIDRGILKTRDITSFAGAFDPWADRERRLYALDDASGLVELRRFHPDLPVFLSLAGDEVGRLYASPPPPGVLVQLETAWPTFVRPRGLASRVSQQDGAGGGNVLLLSHATPGASVEIPFETAIGGNYHLRVDAFSGPDEGDYALQLDGDPLADLHGFSEARGPLRGVPADRWLAAGRHVLVARCTGHDLASTDYDVRLDVLVGEP